MNYSNQQSQPPSHDSSSTLLQQPGNNSAEQILLININGSYHHPHANYHQNTNQQHSIQQQQQSFLTHHDGGESSAQTYTVYYSNENDQQLSDSNVQQYTEIHSTDHHWDPSQQQQNDWFQQRQPCTGDVNPILMATTSSSNDSQTIHQHRHHTANIVSSGSGTITIPSSSSINNDQLQFNQIVQNNSSTQQPFSSSSQSAISHQFHRHPNSSSGSAISNVVVVGSSSLSTSQHLHQQTIDTPIGSMIHDSNFLPQETSVVTVNSNVKKTLSKKKSTSLGLSNHDGGQSTNKGQLKSVKPVSAYALFFRNTQASIKAENPAATFGEISKIVASKWELLKKEDKEVYKERADHEKKNYLQSLASNKAKEIALLKLSSADDGSQSTNITTKTTIDSSNVVCDRSAEDAQSSVRTFIEINNPIQQSQQFSSNELAFVHHHHQQADIQRPPNTGAARLMSIETNGFGGGVGHDASSGSSSPPNSSAFDSFSGGVQSFHSAPYHLSHHQMNPVLSQTASAIGSSSYVDSTSSASSFTNDTEPRQQNHHHHESTLSFQFDNVDDTDAFFDSIGNEDLIGIDDMNFLTGTVDFDPSLVDPIVGDDYLDPLSGHQESSTNSNLFSVSEQQELDRLLGTAPTAVNLNHHEFHQQAPSANSAHDFGLGFGQATSTQSRALEIGTNSIQMTNGNNGQQQFQQSTTPTTTEQQHLLLRNCVRSGCTKQAIESIEWDGEFCSEECCVKYCETVFQTWTNSKKQQSNIPLLIQNNSNTSALLVANANNANNAATILLHQPSATLAPSS